MNVLTFDMIQQVIEQFKIIHPDVDADFAISYQADINEWTCYLGNKSKFCHICEVGGVYEETAYDQDHAFLAVVEALEAAGIKALRGGEDRT